MEIYNVISDLMSEFTEIIRSNIVLPNEWISENVGELSI